MRDWLKMSPTETNIKKNCSHFIKIYYKILKEFEKYPNKKWIRRFSLLPTKNDFLMSNIEIDDTCLLDIVSYITEETNENILNEFTYDQLWKKLFNLNAFETQNRRFSNTIYTDGVSVSIRIAKPKIESIVDKNKWI